MKLREIKYLAVLWAAALGVYLPPALAGRVLVDEPTLVDVTFNFMPNISWMARSWSEGYFPLWNFHTHFGMPHLGYSHSGGLYPITILLFTRLPYPWAGTATIILHALAAGSLLYLAARREGLDPLFALAAGTAFVLAGPYFGMTYIFWTLGSVCGLLLCWVSLRALFERARFASFAGAALGVAWCGLAGDVELLAYGLPVLGLVLALRAGPSRPGLARAAWTLAPAAAAGMLLLAALALPVLETVRHSIRGPDMPYDLTIISAAGEWKAILLTLLFPFRYYRELNPAGAVNHGLPPLYHHFLFPLLLVWSLAAAAARKPERPLALAWAIVFGYFALREWGAADRFLDALPVLGQLKFPEKGIIFIQLIGLLAGFRALSRARQDPKAERTAAVILLLGGAAMMAAQPWCLGGWERYAVAGAAIVAGAMGAFGQGRRLAFAGGPAVAAAALVMAEVWGLALRSAPRTDPGRFELSDGLRNFARQLPPTLRYAVFEPLLTEDLSGPPPIFGTFELASGAGNIVGPSRIQPARSFVYISQLFPALVYQDPAGKRYLDLWSMTNSGLMDRGRMHLFNLAGTRAVIGRGMPVPYSAPYPLLGPHAVDWRRRGDPLPAAGDRGEGRLSAPSALECEFHPLPGDRLRLAARAEGAWAQVTASGGRGSRLLLARALLRGVDADMNTSLAALDSGGTLRFGLAPVRGPRGRAEVSAFEIVNPGRPLQRQAEYADGAVYLNAEAMPRAFVAHRAEVMKDWDELVARLRAPSLFSPLEEVLLEGRPEEVAGLRPPPGDLRRLEGAAVRSYSSQRVEIEARLTAPGVLVFTDGYFPGWKALVSGGGGPAREARIYPADLAFRAVLLPENSHRVVMVYEPASFRVGLGVSAASLGSLCLAGVFFGLARRRRPSAAGA